MTLQALEGVRVLDLSSGIAGPAATMLLAEAGADVVKVEAIDAADDRATPGWRTWNRSKRSVIVDLDDPAGLERLASLLAAADVLVHEFGPALAGHLGLDDATLAARFPRLIVSSVLAWPANHVDADLPVDELLAMARLGVCDEQFAMRRDGPVFVRFPLGSWGAAYLAVIGILARLHVRDVSGLGGQAHTSLVQGALVPMGMHWSRAERPSESLAVGMPKASGGSQATLFQCADGEWFHLMGNPLLSPRAAEATAAGADLTTIFGSRPRDEWLADLWAHDVPAQPALPFGAVLNDQQARLNGYIIDLEDPELGTVTTTGNPLSTDPPCTIRNPAPAHGAHSAEVLAEWTPRPTPSMPAIGRKPRYPLEGLRVLDLGNYLAGPYGPMILADLGAEVIKVEATTGDGMRPTEWAFAGCQRGKRGVTLDLKSPASRPVLEELVRWADVVHHNIRMPAARRLALDSDTVLSINPKAVYCHTSSYGPVGPRADWPGYDQLFQALCGWEVLGAGDGNPPMWHRFGFMDHQCALASVVATLLALRQRDRTGDGQVVASSLLGAGLLTTGETYQDADGVTQQVLTLDADQTGTSRARRIIAFADGWIAVTADPGDVSPTLSVAEALAAMTAAGIPAEVVREDQRDSFLDSPANRAAGLVASYPHPVWGQLEQPGALWWFGDLEVRLHRAPPTLGQHTAEVLAELEIVTGDPRQI